MTTIKWLWPMMLFLTYFEYSRKRNTFLTEVKFIVKESMKLNLFNVDYLIFPPNKASFVLPLYLLDRKWVPKRQKNDDLPTLYEYNDYIFIYLILCLLWWNMDLIFSKYKKQLHDDLPTLYERNDYKLLIWCCLLIH